MAFRILLIIHLIVFSLSLFSCSQKKIEIDEIKGENIDEQMIKSYNEGLSLLNDGDGIGAAKKFSEAEILYPQSIWAPRSALMTAYSYYSNELYQESISELNRYLQRYPFHNRKNYAYYLMALSHYEQIVDEKKDLEPIINAKKYFELIVAEYPKSEFAIDANYKLELIQDMLASKEMYLGRYYLEKEKWIPAINRFKTIIEDYDTTIYVEEALHRLVEVHYKIGLIDESKKYASTLGYNYQSGEWYKKTYKLFNKNYSENKAKLQNKQKKSSFINRFKSLLK